MIEKIFNIVIEKEDDEESYFIHCPQLKGCATQGDNIEDALLMFSEALNVYMKSIIKYGDIQFTTQPDLKQVLSGKKGLTDLNNSPSTKIIDVSAIAERLAYLEAFRTLV